MTCPNFYGGAYRKALIVMNEPANTVMKPKTVNSGLMTLATPPTSTIGPSACIATRVRSPIDTRRTRPPVIFTIKKYSSSYKNEAL